MLSFLIETHASFQFKNDVKIQNEKNCDFPNLIMEPAANKIYDSNFIEPIGKPAPHHQPESGINVTVKPHSSAEG